MKNVLITGGSRGIGKQIAEMLKAEGYNVYAPTREELNLADPNSVNNFITKHKNAKVDIIINNAGINDINLIEDVTDDEIDRATNINLISPMKLIRAYVPYMKQNKFGRIINIGSILGVVSKGGRCVYSATKHGLHGVTQTLAVELAEYNILVNTVCPGFTLTELTRKNNTPEQIEQISQEIPLKRMAQPQEIADLVCYLVGERNSYITGQQICVDGGYTSK